MIVDLVQTTTSDDMRLDGALHSASDRPAGLSIDALVCLHGVGGNFYSSSLLERITPDFLGAGVSMLWANTRGHDLVHTARVGIGGKRQGAAYEIVDECRMDVAAWMQWLEDRGFSRIGILGHSLGAIKAIYSEAQQPCPQTRCVIAVSAPRLSCASFRHGSQAGRYSDSLHRAERYVREGRAGELIEVSFPFAMAITARGFIDKYGPQERYNLVRFANRVAAPMLLIYGETELEQGGVAFSGVPEALQALECVGPRPDLITIAGADHNYTGKHRRLSSAILTWLRGVAAP